MAVLVSLADRIKTNRNLDFKTVIFDSGLRSSIISGQPDVKKYLFGEDGISGHFDDLLQFALGQSSDKTIETFDPESGQYKNAYKLSHNCATVFKNVPTAFESWKSRDSKLTKSLIQFARSTTQPQPIYCNHFCTILAKLANEKEYINDKPELIVPLITHPDWPGFSGMIFFIAQNHPEFYGILSKRLAEFMRYAISENNQNYARCSYLLLNVFSVLIKSTEIDIPSINVEFIKDILDATLSSYDLFRTAFYEGIFIVSSIITMEVEETEKMHLNTIKKYVEVRGECYYSSLTNLPKDKIAQNKLTKSDINDDYEKAIRAFPVFFASGWNEYKFFDLMFNKNNVVTSDFNRACFNYIVSFDMEQYQDFIESNNIVQLIQKTIPPFPSDPIVLKSTEIVEYLNPYVIMLALYIFDGLPSERGTGNNKIIKNTFTTKSTITPEFVNFVIQDVLPYKEVMFPDLNFDNSFGKTQMNGD